jgi:hypothetical protein
MDYTSVSDKRRNRAFAGAESLHQDLPFQSYKEVKIWGFDAIHFQELDKRRLPSAMASPKNHRVLARLP